MADVVACEWATGQLESSGERLGDEDGAWGRDRLDAGSPADMGADERILFEHGVADGEHRPEVAAEAKRKMPG
jgi:hypothetical protein